MTDGAYLSIDRSKLTTDGDKIVRRYLSAGTAAVSGTTRRLEKSLEAATQAAVPGKLYRAWQSSSFPKIGPARNPVGSVFSAASTRTHGAITYWTKRGSIGRKEGRYFAVPLPAAGSRGRLRDLTPEEWERRTGQTLRFVPRRGRAPLLVADNSVISGKRGVARANTVRRQAAGRGNATIPIFVLIPLIKNRGSVAVEPLIRAAERDLPAAFLREVSDR